MIVVSSFEGIVTANNVKALKKNINHHALLLVNIGIESRFSEGRRERMFSSNYKIHHS